MEKVILNRTSRVLAGHPWVFSNEIQGGPKGYTPGSVVSIHGRKGEFIGRGYINPRSLIAVRILTRRDEEIDASFFRDRVARALEYRKKVIGESGAFRAVFSEADCLPGLIVDCYGRAAVVQTLTLGMEALKDMALDAVDAIVKPEAIFLRNDSSSRALEGLAPEKGLAKGSSEKLPVISEGGALFEIDPLAGQKTGFFLDQRFNRIAFASLAKAGGAALDLFCYTGAWSVALGKKGVSVTGVDSSEAAVKQAQRNAELNGLGSVCGFIRADVFDYTKELLSKGRRFDYVVLDPPAFIKSKAKIREGERAYRDLNAMCMRLLKPGGLIATSSCSYHMEKPLFTETLRAAARDARVSARVIEARSQAPDHPVLLSVPETEYLKCLILEVSPA